MTKRSAFNHETRDSARLPASSQRIIHLHQARPECGKILHESGVRKMLDTMEKTKKRYWHEELANCLGHVFDPQMLPDMERSDFCKRLGQQAIERVKGSDRLASGDMESNFSLNDTSRESSVQIYMDFMKTIAKHPDAQAVVGLQWGCCQGHPGVHQTSITTRGSCCFWSSWTDLSSEWVDKQGELDLHIEDYRCEWWKCRLEESSRLLLAALLLRAWCQSPSANDGSAWCGAAHVAGGKWCNSQGRWSSHFQTCQECSILVAGWSQHCSSGQRPQLSSSCSGSHWLCGHWQNLWRTPGWYGCRDEILGPSESRLLGSLRICHGDSRGWPGLLHLLDEPHVPHSIYRGREKEHCHGFDPFKLGILVRCWPEDEKDGFHVFQALQLVFNFQRCIRKAIERWNRQAWAEPAHTLFKASGWAKGLLRAGDLLLCQWGWQQRRPFVGGLHSGSTSREEVCPERFLWFCPWSHSFVSRWMADAQLPGTMAESSSCPVLWKSVGHVFGTASLSWWSPIHPHRKLPSAASCPTKHRTSAKQPSIRWMKCHRRLLPNLKIPFRSWRWNSLMLQHNHFIAMSVSESPRCRPWYCVATGWCWRHNCHPKVHTAWCWEGPGFRMTEVPKLLRHLHMHRTSDCSCWQDYGDLDLQPISAGFEWHRFAATPVLVRDHRPWHMKLQLKTACAQKQHVHLLLRIPDQVKAFMRLKVLKDGQDVSPVVSQGKGDAFLPLIHNEYELEGSLEFDMTVEFHPQSETGAFPLLVQGLSRSCDGELHFLAGDDRKDVGLEMMKDCFHLVWQSHCEN